VTSLAKLREFAREKPPVERCDLCGAALAGEHAHLIEPPTRRLLCACEACGVLFSARDLSTKYRRVPRRARFLENFEMTDVDWDSLMIPIAMAFFFYSAPIEKMMALYPSPAGATESLLSLDAWEQIVQNNPVLSKMEPDIEALLVNRVSQVHEYYIAPMDQCYKLVGLIRGHWRGLSGGSEVWDKIGEFFAALKERS
jgi:hypothetical protein